MTYAQHELSAAFPSMPAEELQALADDIDANGQREPIVIFEGAVLDGWHRYQACLSLGIAADEVQLPAEEDPVRYVKSRNLHRRHLTGSQRAAAVVACGDWLPRGRQNKSEPGSYLPMTAAQMAREADVTPRTIQQAKTAHAAGLGEAVREGKVTVKRAAEIAKLPKKERAAAVDAPRPTPAKTAKQAVAEQVAEDAHGGFDPLAELEHAHAEVQQLTADLAVAEADDQKAETLKWRRSYQVAEKRQGELMDAAHQAQKHAKFLAGQLARCGRAVGETDTDKIAPTVEAFVRKHTKAAA